ncbi:MAG: ATP-dependent zinc metalloprotease FtsH [Acidimicrobiia bacterium]
MNRTFRTLLIYGLVFVVLAVVAQQWFDQIAAPAEISLSEFESRLDEGNIESVVILERSDRVQGRMVDSDAAESAFDFIAQYPPEYEDDITQRVIASGIEVENDTEPPSFFEILIGFLPWLFLIGFMIFIFMQMQGSGNRVMQFGKAKAKTVNKDQPKVTFKDVAGIDEAIEELEEIKDFLSSPDKYRALGAKIPKGVLLFGPPGTGKTLLARAIAGEAGVPFLSISGSDFVEMFVGVGASRVRDLFDQAKQTAPAIVFIDEIDAVGRHRGAGLGGGHDEREQTLNQLLVELDGFEGNTGVIVMAATNRPDILDPALLRPGRFDRQIIIDAPDIKGREGILSVHARGKPFDSDVELALLARRTPGFTGADLANLINEAALLTARRRKTKIGMSELEEAIDRVMAGPERKTRVMSEQEKKLTAYHEGGHALVGFAMPHLDPIHKVTIIPRGRAGGYTLALPTEDRYYKRRSEMVDELAYALGGRTAEEIVFGDPSTGASNDIEKATRLARRMVMEFGMSDRLGPMKYGHGGGEVFLGRDYSRQADYSDEVASWIDEEVRALINAAHEEARQIINSHIEALHRLVDELMERETLGRDEVAEIFHDVPKWEHANGGALRIQRPTEVAPPNGGIAAAHQSEPTRSH